MRDMNQPATPLHAQGACLFFVILNMWTLGSQGIAGDRQFIRALIPCNFGTCLVISVCLLNKIGKHISCLPECVFYEEVYAS